MVLLIDSVNKLTNKDTEHNVFSLNVLITSFFVVVQ